MSEYNPELLVKFDEVRAKSDEGGFYGELETKRSDHPKAKLKRYALCYNYVDVKFPWEEPYVTDTKFGRRWIFNVVIVDADADKHDLSIVEEDGSYKTSWFPSTFKFSKCNACDKTHKGKHVKECDCGSDNVKHLWECRTADDFAKVLNATGYDEDRWEEFTYRISVSLTKKGFAKYSLDLVEGPSDAKPRPGKSLVGGAAEEEQHFPEDVKEKLERLLVPTVQSMAQQDLTVTLQDWIATLLSADIGIESEAEAERLWDHRRELKGWPASM